MGFKAGNNRTLASDVGRGGYTVTDCRFTFLSGTSIQHGYKEADLIQMMDIF